MKACLHQLCSELKASKNGSRSVSKYVLCVRAITDLLMAVGHPNSEHDQVDVILQGLPEEYSPFIMMVYGKSEPKDMYDVEGLLYVQEAHLDKYCQELSSPSTTTDMA